MTSLVQERHPELGSSMAPSEETVQQLLASRANSIQDGTSEIQRNILAERLLGLPREPRS